MNMRGFTIIEIIVVVAVVGVMASVTIVGGGSYLDRAAESNTKNSLIEAAREMKKIYNRQGAYPVSLPSNISPLSGVELALLSGGETFCLQASSRGKVFYISDSSLEPQAESCGSGSGGGGGEEEPGPTPPGPTSYSEAVAAAGGDAGSGGSAGPSSNCLFNESGSAYVNFSCNGGLNGQLQPNAPTFVTQQPGAILSNPSNTAIGFNGNSHYSYGNPGTSLNNQGANWSVGVWVKPNQSASSQAIVSADDNWALRFNGGSGFTCAMRTGSPWNVSTVSGGPSSVAGQWYHVVCTYQSGTLRLYVNGQLVGTATGVPNGQSGNGNFRPGYINSGWTSGGYLNGYIDEFVFYKTTLSATDISNLYTQAGY